MVFNRQINLLWAALLLLIVVVAFAAPEITPGPAPQPAADSPDVGAPAPSIALAPVTNSPTSSPPAPPPETRAAPASAPGSSPASSPSPPVDSDEESPVPAPSPSQISDISHKDASERGEPEEAEESDSGMNGGKKAGIAVGVIAAACLVGLGGFVYKKRQDNIRRSQYGYAARREML